LICLNVKGDTLINSQKLQPILTANQLMKWVPDEMDHKSVNNKKPAKVKGGQVGSR
jgi:hypothetical protein